MEAKQLHTISGQEKRPEILHSVFMNVMRYAESENGDNLEVVAFTASNYGYTIGFYANQEDGYELIVDEFGHMVKGEWVDCEPTDKQIKYMKDLINKEIERINKAQEYEAAEHAYKLQCREDERRYGHPGAIYNKYY